MPTWRRQAGTPEKVKTSVIQGGTGGGGSNYTGSYSATKSVTPASNSCNDLASGDIAVGGAIASYATSEVLSRGKYAAA